MTRHFPSAVSVKPIDLLHVEHLTPRRSLFKASQENQFSSRDSLQRDVQPDVTVVAVGPKKHGSSPVFQGDGKPVTVRDGSVSEIS